jgi:hypothetical protein
VRHKITSAKTAAASSDCGRQFIGDHEMTYRGCLSRVAGLVKIMLVQGIGIRDISTVLKASITMALKVL